MDAIKLEEQELNELEDLKPHLSISRRFTTPTPEAAASLPTPPPRSPAEAIEPALPFAEHLAQTASYNAAFASTSTLTPAPTPAALQSPVAVASTSRLPLPRPPPSPTNPRPQIPLDLLIPVGSIRLSQYGLAEESELDFAEGWTALAKGLLQRLALPVEEAAAALDDESVPVVEEPAPPSPVSGKSKGEGKRKASASPASPVKKRKTASEDLVAHLIHLQDALVLRATFRVIDSQTVVLRVYLVPSDLPQLGDSEYQKGKRARPAVSVVLKVLDMIDTSEEIWEGDLSGGEGLRLLDGEDKRSILELYRAVSSPSNDPSHIDRLENASELVKDLIARAVKTGPEGLIAALYSYQKASLAKMLQLELAPQSSIDPSYIRRTSAIDDSPFFVSVGGEVRKELPRIVEPRSGILAEDMGSGKTCICLALILSTLRELPRLEGTPTYFDGSAGSPRPQIMTYLARNFPYDAEMQEETTLRPRVQPPLLRQQDMDVIEWERYEQALAREAAEDARRVRPPLPSLRQIMLSYVRTSPTPIHYSTKDKILVGAGLYENLEDTNPYYNLRPSPGQMVSRHGRQGVSQPSQVYVTSATLVVVPTDLVRQWRDQLKEHVERDALRVLVLRTKRDGFKTAQQLAAYDLILMSTSRFSDAADDPTSPLRRAHFRRLIVDEGHTLAGDNRMRKLAEELRVQSRWAISGTPSTNLRSATAENEGALFTHDSNAGGSEVDFNRLGQLFSRFLRHPSFPNPVDWRLVITDPILKHGRGAERLARVLDNAIVRNAPDRLKEAELPPLTRRVVYVELGETERKTYNALIAVFKINSVLSQRKDQDYLFAPRQKKYLDELTTNLAASSFFFASPEFYTRMHDAIKYSEEALESDKSLKWSEDDRQGLKKAVAVMREALEDPEWTSVNASVSVNLDVQGLDDVQGLEQELAELVKVFGGLSKVKNARGRTLLPLNKLVPMRRDVEELRKRDAKRCEDDEELLEELITFEQRRQREAAAPSKGKAADSEAPKQVKKKRKKGEVETLHPFPDDSLFHRIQLGSSTSAKLNFVVSEVRKHQDDKFIVFSSSLPDLVFANLSEAFDKLGIRHIIFAGHGNNNDRGATAAWFNSSTVKECQVILVNARLGGRGICLTAATKVIMIEPIWEPDLEVQAAKRAHRLGQTKPVELTVLVVPGSYEDALLKRRADLNPIDFSKTKQPQRDSKLANLLQSATYLGPSTKPATELQRVALFPADDAVVASPPSPPSPPSPIPVPRLTPPPPTLFTSGRAQNATDDGEPPKKKVKKAVRFA